MNSLLDSKVKAIIQDGYTKFLLARGLQARVSQKRMIATIANTLGSKDPGSRIGIIEAATGTGKTVAYLLAALPIARELKKTLVISTGTIALQEQLVNEDIPELLAACDWDYKFSLVKGRGRYVCNLRLHQHTKIKDGDDLSLNFLTNGIIDQSSNVNESLYKELLDALVKGNWDGDRDSWGAHISDRDWNPLTVDRRQCTGRYCKFINECAFFTARNNLEENDCFVVNHDLVMADLVLGGGVILPKLDNAVFIFDEGHRLAECAIRHFRAECKLNSSIIWLESIVKQCSFQLTNFGDDASFRETLIGIRTLTEQLSSLFSLALPLFQKYESLKSPDDKEYRFPLGDIGDIERDVAKQISDTLRVWIGVKNALKDKLSEKLGGSNYKLRSTDLEYFFQLVGAWQTRAEKLLSLWDRLKTKISIDETPPACWLSFDGLSQNFDICINSSPISAKVLLAEGLWSNVAGAILTSATLRSLGSFNSLRFEAGLPSASEFLALEGPFNYAKSAKLRVPKDAIEGNLVEAHNLYVIKKIGLTFDKCLGTLALFSSRGQMLEVFDGLSKQDKKRVLMQGKYSNGEILRLHRKRIDRGDGSVIFGLSSFAEGIDLPGDYCRHVVVVKLPFAVPKDPLMEARSEWIEAMGGNAFFDIALPSASLRLNQACGRLLRKETDSGVVTILDRRIISKSYGSRLLDALPPFSMDLCY